MNNCEVKFPNGLIVTFAEEPKCSLHEFQKIGYEYLECIDKILNFYYEHCNNASEILQEFQLIFNKCIKQSYIMGKNNYPMTLTGSEDDSFKFTHPSDLK